MNRLRHLLGLALQNDMYYIINDKFLELYQMFGPDVYFHFDTDGRDGYDIHFRMMSK